MTNRKTRKKNEYILYMYDVVCVCVCMYEICNERRKVYSRNKIKKNYNIRKNLGFVCAIYIHTGKKEDKNRKTLEKIIVLLKKKRNDIHEKN